MAASCAPVAWRGVEKIDRYDAVTIWQMLRMSERRGRLPVRPSLARQGRKDHGQQGHERPRPCRDLRPKGWPALSLAHVLLVHRRAQFCRTI